MKVRFWDRFKHALGFCRCAPEFPGAPYPPCPVRDQINCKGAVPTGIEGSYATIFISKEECEENAGILAILLEIKFKNARLGLEEVLREKGYKL